VAVAGPVAGAEAWTRRQFRRHRRCRLGGHRPAQQLRADRFQAQSQGYEEVARIKVSDSPTFAYPVLRAIK